MAPQVFKFGRVLVVAAMATAYCGQVAAETDWSTDAIGGGGGNRVAARCDPGQYLVGVSGRVGDDMDAIAPICARAPSGGARSDIVRKAGFGGSGGNAREILCPESAPFVRKLEVYAEGARTVVVNTIYADCGPLTGAMPRPVAGYNASLSMGGPLYSSPSLLPVIIPGNSSRVRSAVTCPSHMIPVGVQGRAGAMVDALGLICGEIAPAPPAKPKLLSKGLGKQPLPPPEAHETCAKAHDARKKQMSAELIAALEQRCRKAVAEQRQLREQQADKPKLLSKGLGKQPLPPPEAHETCAKAHAAREKQMSAGLIAALEQQCRKAVAEQR
ncbi:hypothetical protein [Reyranella sp. CPCC 100927]|uniref:hypothetical protein n=1 Tax=Reyranella sp. CPCC 100927 TaxID=2599616 RepID=UPI0011B84EE6|nr:hypothetical protein [Reyranella sp. CPCC 100927]TWS97550.1 hypothetical protein FQU96_37055 [Reyranella sp. CPCC 100927]